MLEVKVFLVILNTQQAHCDAYNNNNNNNNNKVAEDLSSYLVQNFAQ